ncbi:hypothetical protein ACI3E1_04085 [Ligilactobacillus sp. LYQ139]|uniref:hypothetical protein n=1 Tax=Ligilactobacillus sp. LYQ139 TaxID=3378800 RepID=UPI0038522FCC
MKRQADVRCDSKLHGQIKLQSGEIFLFFGGENLLFILFPILQWFMPIYCWRPDSIGEYISKPLITKRMQVMLVSIVALTFLLTRVLSGWAKVPSKGEVYKVRIYPPVRRILRVAGWLFFYIGSAIFGVLIFLKNMSNSAMYILLGIVLFVCFPIALSQLLLDPHDCKIKFVGKR